MSRPAEDAPEAGWLRSIVFAVAVFTASRVALFLIGVYSFRFEGQSVPWLHMWIQWDAGYYLSIADHGYMPPQVVTGYESGQSNINFFPLLPMGVALLARLGLPVPLAGVAFANVCLVVAAVLLHRLACRRAGSFAANWAVISLMALPGSFALSGPLSESIFLAFSIAAAYLVQRGRLASAVASVALGAGMALDWVIARVRRQAAPYRNLMLISFIPLPLLALSAFMFHVTGDNLAPLHSNLAFWDQQFGVPFQSLAMFLWTNQPRLQVQSVLTLVMVAALLSQWRLFTAGELFFVAVSVFSFASSEAASPSLIRYTIGLYPVHLAMGRLCATRHGARVLLVALAFVNGALAIYWFHGRDVYV